MRLCVICERSTERENACPVCGAPLCEYTGCSWNHYDECPGVRAERSDGESEERSDEA